MALAGVVWWLLALLWHLADLFGRLTPRSLTANWQIFVQKR